MHTEFDIMLYHLQKNKRSKKRAEKEQTELEESKGEIVEETKVETTEKPDIDSKEFDQVKESDASKQNEPEIVDKGVIVVHEDLIDKQEFYDKYSLIEKLH